jgi:hypothetical protein
VHVRRLRPGAYEVLADGDVVGWINRVSSDDPDLNDTWRAEVGDLLNPEGPPRFGAAYCNTLKDAKRWAEERVNG